MKYSERFARFANSVGLLLGAVLGGLFHDFWPAIAFVFFVLCTNNWPRKDDILAPKKKQEVIP